jgi:hypothetical protein
MPDAAPVTTATRPVVPIAPGSLRRARSWTTPADFATIFSDGENVISDAGDGAWNDPDLWKKR